MKQIGIALFSGRIGLKQDWKAVLSQRRQEDWHETTQITILITVFKVYKEKYF